MVELKRVCRGLPAIDYSRNDTEETRRQVVGNNAFRDEMCRHVD